MLTVAFVIVAVVPLMFLGFWVARTALNKEIDTVWEKHLLLADQTAAVLERYAINVEHAFDYFAGLKENLAAEQSSALIAEQLSFRSFCIIDDKFRVVRHIRWTPERAPTSQASVMTALMPLLHNRIAFSPVMLNADNVPTIYLFKRIGKNRIALAALGTEYLVRLQSSISFGQRGHATIIDHLGNVIAHPKDSWRESMKNITAVEPVKRMVAKERGVARFYSPAIQQEMIAAYTTVPETGWGVMVPQPMNELVTRANDVKRVALILGLIGILAAAFVSWIFAMRLTQPLEAVQMTARRIADGKLNSRVPPLSPMTASDLNELAEDFNEMANRIQSDQRTLATALSRAQSADHAKTRFLANMSHELRTPLNAIIGFSQTMEAQIFGPVGSDRYIDYARDIRQSGEHLLSIINYILDLSKIEDGQVKVEDNAVDVAALARSVESMVKRDAEAGRVSITVHIPTTLPSVRGSEVKLKQVLLNLVSNAVKYTPPNGSVVIGAEQEEGGAIAISVSDTGIGMSKADQMTALIPFGRVESEMSERVNGTGLGLPLAKRFTEIHGGQLEIRSAKGQGTTIIVHLPANRTIAKVA